MDHELCHPVLDDLPAFIIIKSSEYGRFDLIQSVFELIAEEMTHKIAGHEVVSLKLAEILFICIIRHLLHTEHSLAQICEQLGYQSETAFNRAFRKHFDISPGKFRSIRRN